MKAAAFLVVTTPTCFAYDNNLALCAERRSYRLRVAMAGHRVFSLFSFFTPAFIGGLVDCFHMFEGATDLAESGTMLSLPAGVPVQVADVGLHLVLQGSQFDLEKDYLACHRRCDVDWEDEASLGWSPYDSSSSTGLDTPAREFTTSKETVTNVQVKKCVGVVSLLLKIGY